MQKAKNDLLSPAQLTQLFCLSLSLWDRVPMICVPVSLHESVYC